MLTSWQSVETSGVVASVIGPDGSVVVIIYNKVKFLVFGIIFRDLLTRFQDQVTYLHGR